MRLVPSQSTVAEHVQCCIFRNKEGSRQEAIEDDGRDLRLTLNPVHTCLRDLSLKPQSGRGGETYFLHLYHRLVYGQHRDVMYHCSAQQTEVRATPEWPMHLGYSVESKTIHSTRGLDNGLRQ